MKHFLITLDVGPGPHAIPGNSNESKQLKKRHAQSFRFTKRT